MLDFWQRSQEYIQDVQSGKELTCKFIKQAVQRHISDLADQGSARGFWFDSNSAKLYLDAVNLFKHTRGSEFAGKPFDLQPYQCFAFMSIFGWKRYDEDGVKSHLRRFTRVYWETAKKSGKSEVAALLCNLCALFDNEDGAQIYSVATKLDQAKHVFRPAVIMMKYLRRDSLSIRKKVNINTQRIYIEETETHIEPLPADSRGLDGIDTHVGIIDEYHAHDTSAVSDIVRNSMVLRPQPIHFTITTAGFNVQSPCYRIARDEAIKVLSETIRDESLFTLIYTLDEGDDWNDSTLWKKANPSIGRTVKMANMMDLYNAAKNGGTTREVDFKTKNLNIWVHSAYNWISDELFMKAKYEYTLQDLSDRGVMCWGGEDLGQTSDLTCVALLFDPEQNNGRYIFELFSWASENAVDTAEDHGYPYRDWNRAGFLDVTPGNVTDYGYIENKLLDVRSRHFIDSIGYDRANSTQTVINMTNNGFNMEQFNQGIANMHAPTRELEELFIAGVVAHNGNPVMRYMFQNVELVRNSDGLMKVTKKDPNKKVDGVVAMIMALGQYMEWRRTNGGAFKEGFRFFG